MQEKAEARMRELAPPAAKGSQEAGFTQPSLHLFLHVCRYNWEGERKEGKGKEGPWSLPLFFIISSSSLLSHAYASVFSIRSFCPVILENLR